jgi:hypothetical protein
MQLCLDRVAGMRRILVGVALKPNPSDSHFLSLNPLSSLHTHSDLHRPRGDPAWAGHPALWYCSEVTRLGLPREALYTVALRGVH